MKVRGTLLLVVVFKLLDTTMARWNPNSALILVDLPSENLIRVFPLEVRRSQSFPNRPIVYFSLGDEYDSSVITYAFCPPDQSSTEFNYAEAFTQYEYQSGAQLRKRCNRPVDYTYYRGVISYGSTQYSEECTYDERDGFMYHFVYKIALGEDPPVEDNITVYDVCYQQDDMRMILGNYTIQNPSLLSNDYLRDERNVEFDFDVRFVDGISQKAVTLAYLYHPIIQGVTQYFPALVLPHQLLPFAHQRKPLYNYMNVGAMDITLVAGWERFLDGLRLKLSNIDRPMHVSAGLLGLREDDQGNDLYIEKVVTIEGRNVLLRTPVPKIFWLMIYKELNDEGTVIMMHNINYFSAGIHPTQFFNEPRCTQNLCHQANLPDVSSTDFPYIVCCPPNVINRKYNLGVLNRIYIFP